MMPPTPPKTLAKLVSLLARVAHRQDWGLKSLQDLLNREHTEGGRTLRGGVPGTFWKPPSQNPFWKPPSQNRTLFHCKTHSRHPSQNPSENPSPETLPKTFSEPFLQDCVCHTTPSACTQLKPPTDQEFS